MRIFLYTLFLTALCGSDAVLGAWDHPGCPAVTDEDFKMTKLVGLENDKTLWEPLKMAFDTVRDAGGELYTHIYFIERGHKKRQGKVKFYDAMNKTLSVVAELDNDRGNEDGLLGIVLDPKFKQNRRMFLYYAKDDAFRVSRFTVNSGNKLDMESEIIMLKIPSMRSNWHSAGAMQFDAYGDLWINVGDNETMELGPANTADLRGGILRIHPEEDGTYTIPRGNLWEFAANHFEKAGKSDLAAAYRDPAQTKREIYAMGTRNAYTLTLDPYRRWATYGDCGPDITRDTTEEHTIVTEPSFNGWPYWSGKFFVQSKRAYGSFKQEKYWGKNKDPARPINLNPSAEGVDELLPAKRATHPYNHACAMTGPIYRYDGDLQSNVKLPPHFDRVWFVTDFNHGWIKAMTLSEDGSKFLSSTDVFTDKILEVKKPVDFQQGPDGALYILDYSCGTWRSVNKCTGIYKIEYTGDCRPALPKLEKKYYPTPGYGCMEAEDPNYNPKAYASDPKACAPVKIAQRRSQLRDIAVFGASTVKIHSTGRHVLTIRDVTGRPVLTREGRGTAEYGLSALPQAGVYIISVHAEGKEFKGRIGHLK